MVSRTNNAGSAARAVADYAALDAAPSFDARGTRRALPPGRPFSPALVCGLAALPASALLLVLARPLAPLPLIAFVLACAVAPFLPGRGFFLPIVSRGARGARGVALTFDDGPSGEITPRLLELLERQGACATFFVTGEQAARHPGLIREILARGHSIGNHSYSHMPLLMLKGMRTLRREVKAAQTVLGTFGVVPLAFRPPVGITNPHLGRVLREQGMSCVTFSCRAADFGNRRVAGLAARVLRKVAPGDILGLHDVAPPRAGADLLLGEFEALLRGLRERGLEIEPLARLTGAEVMRRQDAPAGAAAGRGRLEAGSAGGYNAQSLTGGRSGSMTLKEQLKNVIIEGINLEEVRPEDIVDSAPLFGEGLGLDSLDAVELVVLMQKHFGIEIKDMEEGREAFHSIDSLAAFVEERRRG